MTHSQFPIPLLYHYPSMSTLPKVAITIGDAAGIGPEVVLKALSDPGVSEMCVPVVVGDLAVMLQTAAMAGLPMDYQVVTDEEALFAITSGRVLFDMGNIGREIEFGSESALCGRAAGQYIEQAVGLWRNGAVDAISTAPLSKRTLALGGYHHPGHTEFLAELMGTEEFAMSFFAGNLRVVLMSTHVPLTRAIELVKKGPLEKLIRFSGSEVSKLIGRPAKVAVAGLNPHASEGGMFGDEEAREMIPAIEQCRGEGIDVSGPYSPDTVFLRGHKGDFDVVVACYHDQATIAVKCLSFGASVNVTLGLPLIRTSVDHGTAFDIAGRNIADAESMKAAISLAVELSTKH